MLPSSHRPNRIKQQVACSQLTAAYLQHLPDKREQIKQKGKPVGLYRMDISVKSYEELTSHVACLSKVEVPFLYMSDNLTSLKDDEVYHENIFYEGIVV